MSENRIAIGPVRAFFLDTSSQVRQSLVNYVNAHRGKGTRSIALCFRGEEAALYYRCQLLLGIDKNLNGAFDFRHARFTENYEDILAELARLGVTVSNFVPESRSKRYVAFPLLAIGAEALTAILDRYKGLIDDYLDPAKKKYAFDVPKSNRAVGKHRHLEKNRQQEIYDAYFRNDGLMYYDLEYAEPEGAKKHTEGRFDLLGLRKETDGYTLLLTELKSIKASTRGKASIGVHESDFIDYLNSPYLETRKEEACEAIRLLSEIFGMPSPEGLSPETIKHVKGHFVFSDNAIETGRTFRPSDERIEKVYYEDGAEKPY